MRRRAFLGAGAAIGAAGAALARPALAQMRTEWRLVTAWPKDLPGLGTGAERFARRVTEMSGGRLIIRVHAAGELVPPLQGFEAVANGTAELSHGFAAQHDGKSRAFCFFTAVPFGFDSGEHAAWIRHGGGQRLWDELCEPFGLKPLLCGNTGPAMAGWFRKEIRKPEDLKGLKVAAIGFSAPVLESLGAAPVAMSLGEIEGALESKTIDAAEGFGPTIDLALGLHKGMRFYYGPGVQQPAAAVQLLIAKAKFDALPADLKAMVEAAASAENDEVLAELTLRGGPAMQILTKQQNVQLRQMPREVLLAQGNAAGALIKDLAEDADPAVRKVAQVYIAARREMAPWTAIGDQGFLEARKLRIAYP
jgi:TRAP-type mannitol/chloroaromatic compound transport system substrate-binding protein